MHAAAYYGMARIAVLEKDPELAERLFNQTLESEPEAQLRAWSLVYLGRLSMAAGERAQAAQYFQSALQVKGASSAAQQAASQGVETTSK
jgi:tetratricopeptide (TPR) repeat protein